MIQLKECVASIQQLKCLSWDFSNNVTWPTATTALDSFIVPTAAGKPKVSHVHNILMGLAKNSNNGFT